MDTRTFAPDTTGPLTLDISADYLELTVEILPVDGNALGQTGAELVLRGEAAVLEGTTARTGMGRWHLHVPAPESTTTGGVTVVNGHVSVVGGGVTVIGSVVSGGIHTSGGVTVIDNTAVGGSAPLRALVRLPAGSSVRSRVRSGRVTVTGSVVELDHQSHNADLHVDRVTGDVIADTHNGNIEIERATGEVAATTHNGNILVAATGTDTVASSSNGNVDITAGTDAPIDVRTNNGDISVRTNGHSPQVRTRTRNGRERIRR